MKKARLVKYSPPIASQQAASVTRESGQQVHMLMFSK